MKKALFAISCYFVCFSTSCNDKKSSETTTTTTNSDKNLIAVHAINKAIETGDVSKLGDYITIDGVDHSGPRGEVRGLDSIKAELANIHNMASDMKATTIKELADSEYVFQWMRFTGTTLTEDMGMPKGTKFDMNALEVSKFNKDGKSTEHWEFIQPSDMMKMMQSHEGAMENKVDTAR